MFATHSGKEGLRARRACICWSNLACACSGLEAVHTHTHTHVILWWGVIHGPGGRKDGTWRANWCGGGVLLFDEDAMHKQQHSTSPHSHSPSYCALPAFTYTHRHHVLTSSFLKKELNFFVNHSVYLEDLAEESKSIMIACPRLVTGPPAQRSKYLSKTLTCTHVNVKSWSHLHEILNKRFFWTRGRPFEGLKELG